MKCEAIILDLKNFVVQKQPSGDNIGYIGILHYFGEILCFGGKNKSGSLSSCKKFNLEKKKWINIESLPAANIKTSAALVNYDVLVCGYETQSILIYFPSRDIFAKSKFVLNKDTSKWIFENWVVCSNGYFYEIDQNNQMIKRFKLELEISDLNSSAYFCRKDFIYIVVTKEWFIRINKKNRIIESIYL